jgi:hypothetical protein
VLTDQMGRNVDVTFPIPARDSPIRKVNQEAEGAGRLDEAAAFDPLLSPWCLFLVDPEIR